MADGVFAPRRSRCKVRSDTVARIVFDPRSPDAWPIPVKYDEIISSAPHIAPARKIRPCCPRSISAGLSSSTSLHVSNCSRSDATSACSVRNSADDEAANDLPTSLTTPVAGRRSGFSPAIFLPRERRTPTVALVAIRTAFQILSCDATIGNIIQSGLPTIL